MPSGDFDDAWDTLSPGFRQGQQTFSGPTVEEIVRALSGLETSGEFLGGGSIEGVFFCAVVILATQAGEEANGVPAEGLDLGGGNLGLTIFKCENSAEGTSAMGDPQGF